MKMPGKSFSRLPTDEGSVRLKRTHGAESGLEAGTISDRSDTIYQSQTDFNYKKPLEYENTFKLDPNQPFNSCEVEKVAETVLVDRLKNLKYEPSKCKILSQELAATIMERLKSLHLRRYKLVAVVSIGSLKERPGMQFGSRCLWNQETDSFASIKFTNESLFAVAMIYGLYYE